MRIYLTKLFLILFLIAIAVRLFYWQVIRADELSAKAENQHFRDIKIKAQRGDIFYSDGNMLTSSNPIFTIFGLPKTITSQDKAKISLQMAKIIWEDEKRIVPFEDIENDLLSKLSKDLYWVLLRKNVSLDLKQKIEQLNLDSIGFEQLSGRFYPEGSQAAHLLGFVGSNAKGEDTGYFGLEGFYEGELKALSGLVRHEKDALGLPILIGRFLTTQAENGKNLRLNIDRTVQFIIEQSLKRGIEKYGAKAASAVVMNPKTGQVLALAAFPNYDPAKYFTFPKEYFKNSVVADQYEPGSIFKVLVMAAAINEDSVKPDTRCDICDGPINLGGFSIRTWNNKYYKDTTMREVIIHSDNTGMVFAAKRLGLDKFYKYLEDFGFGVLTNIDLQDESYPEIRSKEEWREIDLATASFGQGIAVTPIQMIRTVSAIANGGFIMEPQVVNEIYDFRGTFKITPKTIRRVISENTAKIITEMMVAAVEEGEAKAFKPKGFRIAGKTGTAQIPVAGHYDPNKTIASFVGFAPADDPKFIMLIIYDQPTSSPFGSETAAPTFFEIAKQLFTYYKIAPSE